MRYASEDLLSKGKDPNNDTAFDTAVLCDDRWQKKELFLVEQCRYRHIYEYR